MYTREERKRAVELWLKYDKCSTAVSKELGYPCPKLLKSWHTDLTKEMETGVIHDRRRRTSKYTDQQKSMAVQHYLDHGRCIARTVRALGYPVQGHHKSPPRVMIIPPSRSRFLSMNPLHYYLCFRIKLIHCHKAT